MTVHSALMGRESRLDDLFQGVGCRDEVRVSKIGV
jgi:hypothetical protein